MRKFPVTVILALAMRTLARNQLELGRMLKALQTGRRGGGPVEPPGGGG